MKQKKTWQNSLRFIFIALVFLLSSGCKNPLGSDDSRDSSFAPGSGGTGGGADGSSDSEPPAPPFSLQLAGRWATGSNPTSSPIFSWSNPTDDDFQGTQVALGTTPGGLEVLPFLDSQSISTHTFSGLTLSECALTYYPSARAVDTNLNESSAVTEALGFQYDNTVPTAVGSVLIPSNNGASDRTPLFDWSATVSTDNCSLEKYQISIGFDDDADGFDAGDINNVVDWSDVPGGSAVTSYQIIDSVNGFTFLATFNRQYYASIRAIDAAGLASSVTTTVAWYTFHPTQFSNLEMWFDSLDASTLFQDTGCSTTPAGIGDPVGCWADKSNNVNHAMQATGAQQPLVSASGLVFDGSDDLLSVATKSYVFTDDFSLFALYEADVQSNAGGSCCRPIVSMSSTSTGLHTWMGMVRGNLAPNNNLFLGYSGGPINPLPTVPGDLFNLTATHDGTNSLWNGFANGQQRTTNEPLVSYTTTPFNIGGDSSNGARRVAGTISEVIVIESVLSLIDQRKMEGYIACKHDSRNTLDPAHTYYDLVGANKTGCP